MLDIKLVRENPEAVKQNVKNRNMNVDVDDLLKVDTQYTDLLRKVETHRALKNTLSANIAKVSEGERTKLIVEATKVKEELVKTEANLAVVEAERALLLKQLPNWVAGDVPVGTSEKDNKILRQWGKIPNFGFKPLDHVEIGQKLGIIDTEKSSEVAGTRFSYILGGAAKLQFALIQFVLDSLTDEKIIAKLAKKVGNPNYNPFIPVVPPVMIREEIMDKMDRLEPKEDRYIFEKDGLVLIGSAEHTMGPMHMNETLALSDLPKRYIGYSTAFRREAGSYGKDTTGILRVHQFDKLEMESFTTPENGLVEQDLLVAIQEYIVQALGIPYQVVANCTADMGKPDFRQIDIECWMPGQSKYRETHSSDYVTDFQSRRLNIRYEGGELAHMNDATAAAVGRMLIAILENYQQKDGSIKVPKVLKKYIKNGF